MPLLEPQLGHLSGVALELGAELSWSAPVSTGGVAILGYKIEYSTDAGSTWNVAIGNSGSTSTSAALGNLAPGEYLFRVSAINSSSTSTPSTPTPSLSVFGTPPPPAPPEPPVYRGPTFDSPSMSIKDGTIAFSGKKLSSLYRVEVNGQLSTFAVNGSDQVVVNLPTGLEPGRYDLVVFSEFGKLTFINGVIVPRVTTDAVVMFDNSGGLSNDLRLELLNLKNMFLHDAVKVHCLVNNSDLEKTEILNDVAELFSDMPNLEEPPIQTLRDSYSGSGLWVKVWFETKSVDFG